MTQKKKSNQPSVDQLYIFCPKKKQKQIQELLASLNLSACFNNLETLQISSKLKYLHFASRELELTDKEFLVQRIKFGYSVEPLVDYLDTKLKYTCIELLNSDYFLHRPSFSSLRERKLWFIKRLADLGFGLFLLLLFSPIALIVAILVKLDSSGPCFYKQERIGKFNRPFQIIKFRSMYVDAEKDGAKWATTNDPRVTRVGNWIRLLRLDEIPQLINVLRGDMSLVGPRPERNIFIEELEQHISYYRFRHAVKPGLTGWAQVNYPYGASIEDAKWKHRYDIYYIKHQTFWFDIKILFKTISVVIFGKGR
jgi:exopolysaccharide biosynthesis polyprenyl glycosylphosphotransferase